MTFNPVDAHHYLENISPKDRKRLLKLAYEIRGATEQVLEKYFQENPKADYVELIAAQAASVAFGEFALLQELLAGQNKEAAVRHIEETFNCSLNEFREWCTESNLNEFFSDKREN